MKLFVSVAVALSVLATIASPARNLQKRATVAQVQQDLSLLQADLTVLTSSLNAIPNSNAGISDLVPAALNAVLLADTIAQTTADFASAGVIPPLNAVTMLTTIQQIQGAIITAINLVVVKKAPLEAVLPGSGTFALTNFKTLTTTIAAAMTAAAPVTVPAATINTIRNGLTSSFDTAILAFSS